MEEASDELAFSPEQTEALAVEIIGSVLDGKTYDDQQVQGWIDEICSRITKDLVDMNKPYKYIVSCVIMQKNGAGLHSVNSCFWDGSKEEGCRHSMYLHRIWHYTLISFKYYTAV